MAKQTIESWMQEILNEQRDDGHGSEPAECTQLALVHRVGDKKQEVFSTSLKGRQWDAKKLAEVFRAKAENFAAELNGTQMFNILAFYGNRAEHQALKAFQVVGQMELEGMATEPPTKEGMMSQGMRHLEAAAQMYIKATMQVTELSLQLAQTTVRDNMALRKENTEQLEVVREAIFKMTELRDQSVTKHLEYQRSTGERQMWMGMVPPLLNTFTGKEIFPQGTADTALFMTLAENMTEEEIMKVQTSLRPELWAPIAQRMGEILQKKRLAAQANGVDKH